MILERLPKILYILIFKWKNSASVHRLEAIIAIKMKMQNLNSDNCSLVDPAATCVCKTQCTTSYIGCCCKLPFSFDCSKNIVKESGISELWITTAIIWCCIFLVFALFLGIILTLRIKNGSFKATMATAVLLASFLYAVGMN